MKKTRYKSSWNAGVQKGDITEGSNDMLNSLAYKGIIE